MSIPTLTSRSQRAAVLTVGLLASLAATSQGNAHAASSSSVTGLTVGAFTRAIDSDCTGTGTADGRGAPFKPDSANPTSESAKVDKTFTDPKNESDTTHVTGTANGTARVATSDDGTFSAMGFIGDDDVKIDRGGLPSACTLKSWYVQSSVSGTATLPDGWFFATVNNTGDGDGYVHVSSDALNVDQMVQSANDSGAKSGLIFLQAGTYVISAGQDLESETATHDGDEAYQGSSTAQARFYLPGAAPAGQKGSATSYVTLAAGRDCTSGGTLAGTLTGTVTSKASTVKSVTLSLAGTKTSKSVTSPQSGAKIVVGGVANKSETVNVSVVLKSGSTVTGSRSYLACTAS